MGVQDIMRAYFGKYEPTNVYAFEFRNHKNGRKIATVYLSLPPESVTVDETQRAKLTPTIGGGYLTDFGNEFKDITIAGTSHFYNVNSAGGMGNQFSPTDGYTEFIKLRYILSRIRDYSLSKDNKYTRPNFTGDALKQVRELSKFAMTNGFLADKVDVIWHDYDYDEHFFVKIERLAISREKADPWTIKYDIQLKAYQVDDRAANSATMKNPEKREYKTDWINNVHTLLQTCHPASMPTSFPQLSIYDTPAPLSNTNRSGSTTMPADTGNNDSIYALNEKLRSQRMNLSWAVGMMQSGVMSPERSLTRADNLQGQNIETGGYISK